MGSCDQEDIDMYKIEVCMEGRFGQFYIKQQISVWPSVDNLISLCFS